MIDPTPLLIEGMYGSMNRRRRVGRSPRVSPRSSGQRLPGAASEGMPVPQAVPPSPAKCLAQASTPLGSCSPPACRPRTAAAPSSATRYRILGESLVGSSPSLVARDGDAGGEGPVDAGCADLLRGDPADLLDQFRIARGAEADVVGEDDCPENITVTVDRIDAVQQRDLESRPQRALLQPLVQCAPVRAAVRGWV